MADTLGYIRSEEQFDLVPNKQKIFTDSFNYFDFDEKIIKEALIYTPYEHFQKSGFTFTHKTSGTYNVKLSENMDLIERAYIWDKSTFYFDGFYRDKSMIFIYDNGEFIGCPTGCIDKYNELLKREKKTSTALNNV